MAILSLNLFLFHMVAAKCPAPTVNYNNESCYLFIGKDLTAHWYTEIAKYPPRGKGVTSGRFPVSLDPCVWDRAQALQICKDAHKMSEYTHLELFSDVWHLPIVETYEEDNWLNAQVVPNHTKIGTHFWIDLVKKFEDYEWQSTGELVTKFFSLPLGIDRWWERAKVRMTPTEESEVMCHEFHTDYRATDKDPYYWREPFVWIKVRGWHPRACFQAYEHSSELDHYDDFDSQALSDAERYWRETGLLWGLRKLGKFKRTWILPEKCYNVTTDDCPNKREKCEDPVSRFHGAFRMRMAPIGVVCEADINEFP